MKRSEAIEKLRHYLPIESGLSNIDDATDLLDFIEDTLQMMPPFSYDIFYNEWQRNRDNTVNGNKWEPEDEEK